MSSSVSRLTLAAAGVSDFSTLRPLVACTGLFNHNSRVGCVDYLSIDPGKLAVNLNKTSLALLSADRI